MSGFGYTTTPDAELEGMAAEGDSEAFAELYNRHFDRVYDFSLRLLRDTDEAADVAQETFLKAMAGLKPGEKSAAFTTWVLTIARNSALNRLRSRRRISSRPSVEAGEKPQPSYTQIESADYSRFMEFPVPGSDPWFFVTFDGLICDEAGRGIDTPGGFAFYYCTDSIACLDPEQAGTIWTVSCYDGNDAKITHDVETIWF